MDRWTAQPGKSPRPRQARRNNARPHADGVESVRRTRNSKRWRGNDAARAPWAGRQDGGILGRTTRRWRNSTFWYRCPSNQLLRFLEGKVPRFRLRKASSPQRVVVRPKKSLPEPIRPVSGFPERLLTYLLWVCTITAATAAVLTGALRNSAPVNCERRLFIRRISFAALAVFPTFFWRMPTMVSIPLAARWQRWKIWSGRYRRKPCRGPNSNYGGGEEERPLAGRDRAGRNFENPRGGKDSRCLRRWAATFRREWGSGERGQNSVTSIERSLALRRPSPKK